jgi:hypothetical protein
VAEARVDEHPEALAKIDRLFDTDHPGTTLWAAKSQEVIAIQSDSPVVEVVVAHLFGQMRETVSTAGAAVIVVQIFGAG